jgi:hypothetical protein
MGVVNALASRALASAMGSVKALGHAASASASDLAMGSVKALDSRALASAMGSVEALAIVGMR